MRTRLLLVCLGAVVAGCSAHSPMILKNTTDVTHASPQRYPPHSDPVLIVEGPLPTDIEYEIIATIDVGKIWYSGSEGILVEMARRARLMGADAVINIKRWRQPSGFAWAAPHGQGQAVRIRNKDKTRDLSAIGKFI